MEHVLGWITTHSNVFAWGAGKENVVMVSKDFKATRFYLFQYKLNANMADHSVGARDESHESEVSQALMFCF